ncbi:MAG: hypothetical protein WCS70_03195 [Verrucomicrobiota bacterium]
MKYRHLLAVISFATVATAGDKPRPAQPPAAETTQAVMIMRHNLNDFYANPTTNAADLVQNRWQNLPADIRRRIGQQHPTTELRILNLESEIEEDAPPVKPTSNTVTQVAVLVPNANSDVWAKPNATPPTDQWVTPRPSPRRLPPPLQYADDLDVFGNRPKPSPARK